MLGARARLSRLCPGRTGGRSGGSKQTQLSRLVKCFEQVAPSGLKKEEKSLPQGQQYFRDVSPSCLIMSIPGSGFGKRLPPLRAGSFTCSGPMEDSPDVGTEVTEVMLICPVIWFMVLKPAVLVAMDTLMFMLLLYMLVFACCPKCGGDCCENMLFPPMLPCAHPFMSDGGW